VDYGLHGSFDHLPTRKFQFVMSRRASPPIVSIMGGTFYHHHPNSYASHLNRPLFTNLMFRLPSVTDPPENWCIVGPSLSGKTTLLNILRGRLLCHPPTAREYPFLSSEAVPLHLRSPEKAFRYVGFGTERMGGSISDGITTSAYLSARYESRRENTDFTLKDYLLGNTELNPFARAGEDASASRLFQRAVTDLQLDPLLSLPVAFLSNGQGRRARIAKALLATPEVLLLDEPFMGLDPPTVKALSPLLKSLADQANPRIILSARPQDPLPEWVTHVIYLRDTCNVEDIGPRDEVLGSSCKQKRRQRDGAASGRRDVNNTPKLPRSVQRKEDTAAEKLVEMEGCQVRYGTKIALGNWPQRTSSAAKNGLFWTVRRGERWGVFGPNGSGKTTIVSLLCSDHPQSYSLPIKLFGRRRLHDPESGEAPMTFWDIQSRIGHSSPEVHQHMPRGLTVKQIIENAWADTFRGKPKLDRDAQTRVSAVLWHFFQELNPEYPGPKARKAMEEGDLTWADEYLFGELSFSAQRVALLARAVIKNPDIVVLDEAFSGMDERVRDKCMQFLEVGIKKTPVPPGEDNKRDGNVTVKGLSERQALICISHIQEEVPNCVREWICLPEPNSGLEPRFGVFQGPLKADGMAWTNMWGT